MPGQESHDLPRLLQVRHVPVEIHPVRALQVQPDLTDQQIVDRDRTLRHRAPPTSTEMPYSTLNQPHCHHEQRPPTSTVRGEASLGYCDGDPAAVPACPFGGCPGLVERWSD